MAKRSLRDAKRKRILVKKISKKPLKIGKSVSLTKPQGVVSSRVMSVYLPESNYRLYRPNNFAY